MSPPTFRPSISRRSIAKIGVAALIAPAIMNPMSARGIDPLKVVATFSILGDWVQRVGGDGFTVTTIVPAGGDAHTFDPNPEQVAAIGEADLIVEIGLGFETWLEDMIASSGTTAHRVVVSKGMELLSANGDHEDDTGEEHDEEHAADDGQDHGEHDPHVWGDVRNAVIAVQAIRAALASLAPDEATTWDSNAATYTSELESLDRTIREQVATIPEDQRKLVTTHDTFGYFAHAYGLEVLGTALNSLSTEGGDPSAEDIVTLVESIASAGVPAIFADNVTNTDVMETIAAEAGVELAPPLYTDALGEPGSDGETYLAMMAYNAETIVTALAGS